jgi:hypothetical protein
MRRDERGKPPFIGVKKILKLPQDLYCPCRAGNELKR